MENGYQTQRGEGVSVIVQRCSFVIVYDDQEVLMYSIYPTVVRVSINAENIGLEVLCIRGKEAKILMSLRIESYNIFFSRMKIFYVTYLRWR